MIETFTLGVIGRGKCLDKINEAIRKCFDDLADFTRPEGGKRSVKVSLKFAAAKDKRQRPKVRWTVVPVLPSDPPEEDEVVIDLVKRQAFVDTAHQVPLVEVQPETPRFSPYVQTIGELGTMLDNVNESLAEVIANYCNPDTQVKASRSLDFRLDFEVADDCTKREKIVFSSPGIVPKLAPTVIHGQVILRPFANAADDAFAKDMPLYSDQMKGTGTNV